AGACAAAAAVEALARPALWYYLLAGLARSPTQWEAWRAKALQDLFFFGRCRPRMWPTAAKRGFWGRLRRPRPPLRKSYYLESSAAIAIYRSFSVKGLLSKGRPDCHKKSRVAALVVSPLMNSSRSASAGAVMRSCS